MKYAALLLVCVSLSPSWAKEESVESLLLRTPDPARLRAWHDRFCQEPHPAGTEADARMAETLAKAFQEIGIEVQRDDFYPYLPEFVSAEVEVIRGEARESESLYVLGDLFDAWLGDDDPNPYYEAMKLALRRLTDSGIPVFFMHGNRDFAVGKDFAAETGVEILEDPTVVDLYGEQVLLSHGDALCTDDVH